MDSDPRDNYLSLISIGDSHVKLSPPIVFFFGGEVLDPPRTVRGVLYKHILVRHPSLSQILVIPEDFKDWLHDSVYPDLLTFEADLAQTSSLIIIALESPGAIAELGSFSVNESLKSKIIIILSEEHHSQNSFIKLGPLRLLDQNNIYAYPYDHNAPAAMLTEYLEDIVNNINTTLSSAAKVEKFNVESNGHVALLIFELVSIFQALKFSEIDRYLRLVGIDRTQSDLRRLLFLLGKLSLVSTKRMGKVDYYFTEKSDQRISFSSKERSKLFDKNSAAIGSAQFYAANANERMRKKVIESISRVAQ